MIFLSLVVVLALALFYGILQLDIPGLWKFVLVVVEMVVVSQIVIKKYKLQSELGMILLKSKEGLDTIERLSKMERIFNFMADVGFVVSYGLLSLGVADKNKKQENQGAKKETLKSKLATLAVGLTLLAFLTIFVAPYALAFIISTVNAGGAEKMGSVASVAGDSIGPVIVIGILLMGGMFLFMLAGIIFYGISVFAALLKTLVYGTDTISKTAAGGTLLLPGINLPFFEGVLALAIVMVVHEVAHAILARIAKVPVKSSGLVLFGVIPVGAFVEPDEKHLSKVEDRKQTRVLVAGPTANFVTSALMFILFIAFVFSTSGFREEGYYVQSGMETGTIIYAINGQSVDVSKFMNLSLPKNAEVILATNKGEITRMTNENAKLGITYTILNQNSINAKYKIPGLEFIYIVLGLGFALNFVVGSVNLLPVPLFDGHRLIDINVKNKGVVKLISYGTLAFFILNFLPFFFH